MPIKQPATDDVQLNMTPMIDIVFNLVTFFMIAVDISHKDFVAVALPRAHSGVEDKDPATEQDPARRETRFNITLTADGRIAFRGNEWRIDGTPELENAMYITDGKEKYLWYSGQGIEQLFDLVSDPTELTDLARKPEMQHRVAHWRARLAQELAGREEGYSDGKRLIPGRPVESVLSFLRKKNQA